MSDTVEATFYVVVQGERAYFSNEINGAKVRKAYVNKPSHLNSDEIAVKLKIRVPARAFEAFQPSAVIEITKDSLLTSDDINVEAAS